jgi:hypothetical protein
MIVIHRGKGGLIIIAGILAALVMQIISLKYFGEEYYAAHAWPKVGTLWLLSALCLVGGLYLRSNPTRPKVNKTEYFYDESSDHLFFIPVVYWCPIFFILGLVYFIYRVSGN